MKPISDDELRQLPIEKVQAYIAKQKAQIAADAVVIRELERLIDDKQAEIDNMNMAEEVKVNHLKDCGFCRICWQCKRL
tara:strand:- start:235 stop:471 length:237 start_codon:yes stop_codon:yes gene_type:complete